MAFEEERNGRLDNEICFPLSEHTANSVVNLVRMLSARGKLLSKATGGDFGAESGLAAALDTELTCTEQALEIIKAYEQENGVAVIGVEFTEDRIIFTGFPETDNSAKLKAFSDIASAMNKQAITRQRITTKPTDDPNEKYIFRTWLVRLGMDGSEFKETRKILLENLNGHTAFHTPADEQKWKERQKNKKNNKNETGSAENE